MGQTLSHGVYLPNEGERNCYAGLASNWQILNTAVGAIAEKAPLVHTHGNITNDGKVGTDANKPLITGTGGAITAGAFGNHANTFCEGNDSRLSDARTPLSHTHTKSDVTDLLNSDFIPSANNSYDLGSSSYQWNNLYAKKVNTQSVNGINPGALSLPDVLDSYDVVTTNWSTAYNQPNDLKINGANPSYPGWLFIRLDNCTAADDFVIVRYFHVNATNLTFFGSFIPTASSYVLSVPIQAGITIKVWVSKIPTTCKYYACLGTVK